VTDHDDAERVLDDPLAVAQFVVGEDDGSGSSRSGSAYFGGHEQTLPELFWSFFDAIQQER
jgi:hypothetical protein